MIGIAFITLGITSSWNSMVYIIIGLFCTGAAKALFLEKDFGGLTGTSVIGVLGALAGAYFPFLFNVSDDCFFSPLHCFLSILFSLLFLILWNKFFIPVLCK